MSFEERQTWIEAAVMTAVPGWYFVITLTQVPDTPVSEIEYQWPLIWSFVVAVAAIVALIIAGTVGTIIIATVRSAIDTRRRGEEASVEVREADVGRADRRDERDASIDRFGGYVGGFVLGVGVLLPLGLAMAERQTFWIANSLYGALVLSALASSAAKIVAYRRGP
jgi:hypothetical protein